MATMTKEEALKKFQSGEISADAYNQWASSSQKNTAPTTTPSISSVDTSKQMTEIDPSQFRISQSYVESLGEGATVGHQGKQYVVTPTGKLRPVEEAVSAGAIPNEKGAPVGYSAPAPMQTPTTTPTKATPVVDTATQDTESKRQAEIAKLNEEANAKMNEDLSNISKTLASKVDQSSSAKLTEALLKATTASKEAPLKTTLAESFATKRAELGVDPLEASLATVDSKLQKLDADYLASGQAEQDRQVSVTQIGRRESQIGKQYTAAKNQLLLEKNAIATQLNQKYAVLDTFMKYTGQDMQNATNEYNTKFNQAINMIQLLGNSENQQTDNARANAQIMMSTLKDKNVDWATLDATTKADITNLELSAGLPKGFMEFTTQSVDKPIISIGAEFTDAQGNRQTPIYTKDSSTGVVTAQTIKIGTAQVSTKNASELPVKDKTILMGSGLTEAEISALQEDIKTYGIDSVLKNSGLTSAQEKAIKNIYEVSILDRKSLSALFGIQDNDEKTGFLGFGKTNKEKLDELMDTVDKYKAVGYTDSDILKMMQE